MKVVLNHEQNEDFILSRNDQTIGLFDAATMDGGPYDVSLHFPNGGINGGHTYTFDSAVVRVPESLRRGGMSIKYINTSNLYEQYRLTKDEWSTTQSDWTSVDNALAEEITRAQAAEANRYTKAETYSKAQLDNMITTPNVNYVVVSDYASLPSTGAADTIYRVSSYDGAQSQVNVACYSEYAWNGTAYQLLAVKSQVDEVFDISAYRATGGVLAKYANLSAALDGGNNVPQSLRKGGMSVKFVQSSDNKYVQFRCIADEFTTDTTQWAIYSESVYVNDPFYVKVYTDANDRIILAITKEGDIKFGAGVPTQIVDYINSKVDDLSSDINERIEEIESIIGTLNETFSFTDDHIWLNVTLDSDGHIVEGVRKDGTKYIAKYDDDIQKLLSDVPTYNDVKKHEGLEVEKRVITYSKTTPENTPDFNNLSNNLLIAFMTDTHIDLGNKEASYNNVKDTISFLNNLHAPIAAIIEGGDVVTPYSPNRQTHKEIMTPFFSRIKDAKMPVLYTKGNHDINAIEASPSIVLTDDDWGEVYFDWAEENYGIVRHTKSNGKKSGYYYYDLEDWKVRIICADCNDLPFDTVDSRGRVLYQPGASTYIAQEQFSWIVNTALNFDDKDDKGWGVILFTHFYRATDVDGTSYAPIYASVYPAFNRMLAAFNSQSTFDEEYTFAENHFFDLDVHGDWTRYRQLDNKPFVICVLSGHVHIDQNYVKDGINNIWTANQFCGDYPADRRIIRIAGSNTQNLFDILSIDLLHKKIRTIRYGAGVTCFGEGGDRFIDNGLSF